MAARRMLAELALLLAAAPRAVACAQVVAGSGSPSADIHAGGPSASPTKSPGGAAGPASPPSSDSGSSTGASAVCDALDEAAVESAFGMSVTFSRSQSSGCQIRADDGQSMTVAVFDYLKLSEYKQADSTDLQVGGYPAVRAATTILYVGRSMDPNAAGLVAAYFGGLREGGEQIAVKVLEQLLAKYAK